MDPDRAQPRVLVVDPEQRAALATVRSLGNRGWYVETIGVDRGLAGSSKFARFHHSVSKRCVADAPAMRDEITRIVASRHLDVVVPTTDVASRALLGFDQSIGAVVAGPSRSAYERASDKAGLLQVAREVGIRVPAQTVLLAPMDADQTLELRAPSVVKPARSVIEKDGRASRVGVRFVNSAATLGAALVDFPEEAYPLLIQERTIGNGVGVFLFRKGGQTLLEFGHRRLREKPPAGGVSTYREAVVPPPDLVRRCEALLDALDYEGPAMIEFKEDATTGEHVLMEINARLWGSVQLAVDAGVDFPSALVASALGLPIPEAPVVRLGTRTWWELGELDHALAIWRKSAEQLSAPPDLALGARAALRALADRRWADWPEVFRWSDPMPFAAELLRWIRRQ